MIVHLTIWFIFSYVVHWFAVPLNNVSFFGWPLGYYMSAQGSLIGLRDPVVRVQQAAARDRHPVRRRRRPKLRGTRHGHAMGR
jgi:uncharacterized membrane protein